MKEEGSYDDYCSQLRMVSDQQLEVSDLRARRANWQKRNASPPPQAPSQEQMDWEPTTSGAAAARIREPRWASPAEIERRRKHGLCLRCGKEGHMVRDCRTKLAPSKEVYTASTKSKSKRKRAEKSNGESSSSDSDGSGKE